MEENENNQNGPEESASADNEIQNPKIVAPNKMEVHHTHHGEKKSWRTYAWEFMMLFLAVFCSFLAEYQLEHQIERERVKKYMHDMVVNLKQDTIRVSQALQANVTTGKGLDSLREEIALAASGKGNIKRIYQLTWSYNNVNGVLFNKSALKQLENSGSLRLVDNDDLVNEIHQYYDRKVVAAEVQNTTANNAYAKCIDLWEEILDMSYLDRSLRVESTFGKPDPEADQIYQKDYDSLPDNIALLDNDPKKLRLLYNRVAEFESYIKGYNAFLRWANEDAKKLIVKIQKEYKF
ncbi:MAG: hypothetical protein LBV59_24130 [Sphingobacterium sp.]|jgi:hypothetical protein|uniref:hypothetical protein n=1 Tax=Sphingobacterium sp. TaxID=341027 RepID=UPI00283B47CA|nr:hypothetical protein [Sphingobacterium sp.]MDR3011036.1 hypothetical protein [Sphingobacterium sp.]